MLLLLNSNSQPDIASFDAKNARLIQVPNLSAARAFAFAACSSRFLDGAFVSSERRRRVEIPAISSTAAMNELSFAFDGLLKPLIFLTNCRDAARISSTVTGGSKLKRILIFLHIRYNLSSLRTLKGAPKEHISRLSDSREAPAALRRGPALVPERDSWRRRS